jgi:hypothetical protein
MTYSEATEKEIEEKGKPDCQLIGIDGNAYSIVGAGEQALRKAGYSRVALDEYREDAFSGDYDHVIQTVMKWTETY